MAGIDNTLLFEILQQLSQKKSGDIYKDLYFTVKTANGKNESSDYSQWFRRGDNKNKKTNRPNMTFWPDTQRWNTHIEINNRSFFENLSNIEDQPIKNLWYPNLFSFESHIYNVLCRYARNHHEPIKCILECCTNWDLSHAEIAHIADLETEDLVFKYLIETAASKSNAAEVTQRYYVDHPEYSSETTIQSKLSAAVKPTDVVNLQQLNKLEAILMTYPELAQYKSAEAIASDLLENDRALYPKMDARNAGTVEQWSALMQIFPETFCFLIDKHYNIIGNWSVVILSARLEKMLLNGELTAEFFTIENLPVFTAKAGDYSLYIMNLSINHGYTTAANWSMLMGSLWNQLDAWADQGIFFKKIYASCHSDEAIRLYQDQETLRFKYIAKNAASGSIYGRTLHPFPTDIGTDSLREKYSQHPWLVLRQLNQREILGKTLLCQIAKLIYETDKYIYEEALFTSEEQAITVLSKLLPTGKDTMFALKNCFVAQYGQDIVGLILWVKNDFCWTNRHLCTLLEKPTENISPFIQMVTDEYFTKYEDTDADINILNFAVTEKFRGTGIGFKLLTTFLKQHSEESVELYALLEDEKKLPLYSSAGFFVKETCRGFSVRDEELNCYLLRREKTQ